jgi:hypothetical protein
MADVSAIRNSIIDERIVVALVEAAMLQPSTRWFGRVITVASTAARNALWS